jgi:hypothetical protein
MSESSEKSSPPKRDKFAALASAQAQASSTTAATATAPVAPKRDKFASMQTTMAAPRRDKFAAVQQQKIEDEKHQKQKKIQARCHQRDSVWKDLADAEAAVCKLLQLAESTATKLTDFISNPQQNIDEPEAFQETLNTIHGLLKPHAHIVQAYRPPTHINRMYLQRVELRIAENKRALLQDYVELTTKENLMEDRKRKRED